MRRGLCSDVFKYLVVQKYYIFAKERVVMISPRSLFLRLVSAIVVAVLGSGILPFSLFYFVFAPLTIYASFFVISLLHGPAVLQGHFISVGDQVIELIPACIAASAYLLFVLLILLTHGISMKKGIWMFVVGSLLILAGNVIRIEVLTSLLLSKQVNYFATLHLLLWKVLSSVYVVMIWIILCKIFSVKGIPVYSDLHYLVSRRLKA